MQPTMEVQGPTPPRHPGMTQPALDGDYDEELHANVTPPPPPPPPPKRRNSKGGSSRHERKIMMMEEEEHDQQQQQQQSREPLNSLTPEATQQQQQQQPPYFPSQKEQSGCDPNSKSPIHAATTTTQSKKPPRSGNKPPKPGTKSAEYASNLESFHLVMLENIEKETMLIRRTGSFQLNQKNLTHKNNERRQQQQHQNHPDNENLKGAHRGGAAKSSNPSTTMIHGANANANNVGDLLKETMNDISVAAASGLKSLQHVIEHTKSGKPITLQAVIGPTACGNVEDSATAFGTVMDEDDNDSLLRMDEDPKQQGQPQRSQKQQQQQVFQLPNIPPGMPKELMKKMHDTFKKVAIEVAAAASEKAGGDKTKKQPQQQQRDDENDNSAEAWGVGNLLANGFGWENGEEEDDDRSRATYDTWDEENSVLRRLGSWGTVNSQFTAGTAGTGATFGTMATYDTEGPSVIGPVSAAIAKAAAAKAAAEGGVVVGPNGSPQNGDQLVLPPGSHHLRNSRSQTPTELKDDDGSLIDPALVEAALKKQEAKKKKKRKGRRKRVVKFDYPPISSLRQYTRPDPEDLPNLFFTEDELDQIEDDRYSTMSTDDIEIVAVASREPDQGEGEEAGEDDDALDAKASAKSKEAGMKSVKGRSGTPTRRRSSGGESGSKKNTDQEGEEANEAGDETNRSSPRRLVKGVQIYLRERSTGT